MSKPIDLTGQTFGMLTVQYSIGSQNGKNVWHCVCSCGREADVTAYDLTRGHTQSCGCLISRKKDLTGERFGRLVALYPTEKRQRKTIIWHCRCDCGNEVDYASTTLRSGNAISCGCSRRGEDLTGQVFGQWTVLRRGERAKSWICRCSCGNVKEVKGANLKNGSSRSCGCAPRVPSGCIKKAEDLTGQKFNQWTVLRASERPGYWLCQCTCGNLKEVRGASLKHGDSKSCGCLKTRVKDYTGQKRGELTAIEATGKRVNKSPEYIWRCECGFEVTLPANVVRPSEDRVCPKCLAKRRKEVAKQMNVKKKEKEIQDLAPGALQNIRDGVLHVNNTSGVRGVWRDKNSGMWVAQGRALGRRWKIGMYSDIRDAAEARENFVEEWYGDAFDELDERKRKAQPPTSDDKTAEAEKDSGSEEP